MSFFAVIITCVLCQIAEACSTTEDGDEPLHCPTGYECHIINPGNPAAGIPNRGQCIKQRGNSGMAHSEIAEQYNHVTLTWLQPGLVLNCLLSLWYFSS